MSEKLVNTQQSSIDTEEASIKGAELVCYSQFFTVEINNKLKVEFIFSTTQNDLKLIFYEHIC